MGRAGRWLRSFLAGRKGGRPCPEAMPVTALPGATPKEKLWSFRRPVLAERLQAVPCEAGRGVCSLSASETAGFHEGKHSAAARLTLSLVEDAAAVRIQATFRGYLARAALCALRGIVKLQAMVRGQLVRKQAKATLRCMQALLAAQSNLRGQRMRLLQEHHRHPPPPPPSSRPRPSPPQHPRQRRSYEMDRSCEENAKIVEMDRGEPARRRGAGRGSRPQHSPVEYLHYGRCSPAPSAMTTELSPRASSGHPEEVPSFGLRTAHSSPRNASAAMEPAAAELFPSYMGNTESSRAKARSQSAPRQRADAPLERQPSRRKGAEHRSLPRGARMQRSSSQSQQQAVSSAAPRGPLSLFGGPRSSSASVKLDSSTASLKGSECGSTSSVLAPAAVYSRTRSLVGFEVRRILY